MSRFTCVLPLLAVAVCASAQECSTEKVNGDCTLTFDRLYPVTNPTIQMRRGKTMTVKISNAFVFETLTLDLQSAQAVAGTDQTAGLVNALMPFTKGLTLETQVNITGLGVSPLDLLTPEQIVQADLALLDAKLNAAESFAKGITSDALGISLQLQEILSPVPRPLTLIPAKGPAVCPPPQNAGQTTASQNPSAYSIVRPSGFPPNTPCPWDKEFEPWRRLLLCELIGLCDQVKDPQVTDILDTLTTAPSKLPVSSKSGLTWTDTSLFALLADKRSFDVVLAKTQKDIQDLTDMEKVQKYNAQVNARTQRESALTAYVNLFSKAQSDLSSYVPNIRIAGTGGTQGAQTLGSIYDPKCAPGTSHCPKSLFLGAQVTFAVDAVNQIGTAVTSVTSASQKKAIATVTVIYADPIFEVSTGALFSTLPNRSFSNITQIMQGANPTPENVVIAQTIVRPSIVPYAAANWRLGHDSTWHDGRRMAWYFTTAAGLNPNNTTVEFAFGPSVSWRSLIFSGLFHLGHDVELTQGEFVGEVWCNQTAATGATPKCGSVPNPTTQKYWTGAFALGIGIRVPTTFGGSGK